MKLQVFEWVGGGGVCVLVRALEQMHVSVYAF